MSCGGHGSATYGGSEVYLAPHDPSFDPGDAAEAVLSIDALCFNRDFRRASFRRRPSRIAAGRRRSDGGRISCLTAPTPTLRPPLRERRFWRLVSHLSLGHLSIVGGAEGAAALREVLRLYDLRDSPEARAAIERWSVFRRTGSRAGSWGARRRFLSRASM